MFRRCGSAETCRSKVDILNVWFTLKVHFVGLSFIIIWRCMVQAANYLSILNSIFKWPFRYTKYSLRYASFILPTGQLQQNLIGSVGDTTNANIILIKMVVFSDVVPKLWDVHRVLPRKIVVLSLVVEASNYHTLHCICHGLSFKSRLIFFLLICSNYVWPT
jgi:hypothetical protein